MSQRSLSPPYAILFVYDPSNKNATTPEYSVDSLVSATRHCISVATRADVDGETNVTLAGGLQESDRLPEHKIFEGLIETPNRKIAVVTAELQTVLELRVKDDVAKVNIWVDDLRNPGTLLITAE